MRIGLILSNDWELFGDGSGDYFTQQHRPLEELMEVAGEFGAKLTIFADVAQQWAHQDLASGQSWAHDVSEAWERILVTAVSNDHDVQLHLHPQWLNVKHVDGCWKLDLDHWAISSLSSSEIAGALNRGKGYLDNLLIPSKTSYRCIAFRAGAYCLQPSNVVISALLKAGFCCDSSVTKGCVNQHYFDYTDAYSSVIPWFAHPDNIKYRNRENEGLLEIPIFSSMKPFYPILHRVSPRASFLLSFKKMISGRDLKWLHHNDRYITENYPPVRRPFIAKKGNPVSLFSKLFNFKNWLTRRSFQLDYDLLPASVFVSLVIDLLSDENVRNVLQAMNVSCDSDLILPVVTSGHVKSMHNGQNVRRILQSLNNRMGDRLVYWTIKEAAMYWREKLLADL